jgi:hypothetical protein
VLGRCALRLHLSAHRMPFGCCNRKRALKSRAVALRLDIEDEDRALPGPGRACTWVCNLPPMELFQLPCCYGRLSALIVSPGPKGPWVTCWRMWKSNRLRACASTARPGLVAGPVCGAQADGPVDEPRGIHLRPLKRTRRFESESRGASSNPSLAGRGPPRPSDLVAVVVRQRQRPSARPRRVSRQLALLFMLLKAHARGVGRAATAADIVGCCCCQ